MYIMAQEKNAEFYSSSAEPFLRAHDLFYRFGRYRICLNAGIGMGYDIDHQ